MDLKKTWQTLTADQKKELCRRVEITYDYGRNIATRNRCGRHLKKAIIAALKKMKVEIVESPQHVREKT
jgi:hypothetical protein